MSKRPLLFAHRGARVERPENTLIAFRHALDLGADALELDVHATRDNVIVVHHDATLARSSGLPVAIRDIEWAALSQVDVGHTFKNEAGERPFVGTRIPRLDEILAELPGVPLNVDLKPDSASLCASVVALIRASRATASVRLASFHGKNLQRVRRAGYEGETSFGPRGVAMLLAHGGVGARWLGEHANAAQVPTHYGPLRLDTPRFVRAVHRVGAVVHYWTINDPREAERLLRLGADGLVTDDVRALAPVFRQLHG